MVVTAAPVRVAQRAWQWKWRIIVLLVVVGLTGLALYLSTSRGRTRIPAVAIPTTKPILAQANVVPVRSKSLASATVV